MFPVMVHWVGNGDPHALPGVAISLAQQDGMKLRVRDLQEVAGHQVTHGTHSEAPCQGDKLRRVPECLRASGNWLKGVCVLGRAMSE